MVIIFSFSQLLITSFENLYCLPIFEAGILFWRIKLYILDFPIPRYSESSLIDITSFTSAIFYHLLPFTIISIYILPYFVKHFIVFQKYFCLKVTSIFFYHILLSITI